MPGIRSAAVRTGIAGGVLFFLNALIPNSRAFPFIWPALTGGVAFWMATNDAAPRRVQRGMLATLIAGAMVGVIGFIGSSLTVLIMTRAVLNPAAQTLGAGGSALVTGAAELGLAVVAVITVGVALVGGVVMIPVRLARSSHSDAPAS